MMVLIHVSPEMGHARHNFVTDSTVHTELLTTTADLSSLHIGLFLYSLYSLTMIILVGFHVSPEMGHA